MQEAYDTPNPTDQSGIRTELPAPAGPVRRTVGLEILTPELRANATSRPDRPDRQVPADATVAIVLRTGQEPPSVLQVDTDWRPEHRKTVDVMASLLRHSWLHADDVTDVLWPTPAVVAALTGQPDTRLLTAPVHILAMDIQPGMYIVGQAENGGGETLELVEDVNGCHKDEVNCEHGAACHVVMPANGSPVHFSGFARLQVRIPAAEAVAR